MPPGSGGDEWLTARFNIDNMYTNNGHTKILAPDQQYSRFYFILNGDVKADSVIELDWIIVWRGEDEEAPSVPSGLKSSLDAGGVTLSWNRSAADLMVARYDLLRKDGDAWKRVSVATSNRAVFAAGALPQGEYAVRAVDVAGNQSEPSQPLRIPSAEQ